MSKGTLVKRKLRPVEPTPKQSCIFVYRVVQEETEKLSGETTCENNEKIRANIGPEMVRSPVKSHFVVLQKYLIPLDLEKIFNSNFVYIFGISSLTHLQKSKTYFNLISKWGPFIICNLKYLENRSNFIKYIQEKKSFFNSELFFNIFSVT